MEKLGFSGSDIFSVFLVQSINLELLTTYLGLFVM
jgi:hypothetical protein